MAKAEEAMVPTAAEAMVPAAEEAQCAELAVAVAVALVAVALVAAALVAVALVAEPREARMLAALTSLLLRRRMTSQCAPEAPEPGEYR